MKAIHEIAQAVSSDSMRKLLSGSNRASAGKSLIFRLFKYLRAGDLAEEDIVQKLYGGGVTVKDPRYRSLKSRLKQIMLGSLLNDEVRGGGYATYDEAFSTGNRQLHLTRVLMIRRAYHAAKEVATTAFRNVRKYEILRVNEGLTDILSSLYIGVLRNPKLFEKYHKLHQYYARAVYDFTIVASKFRLMRNEIYAHQESPLKIGKMSLQFVEDIRPIMESYPRVPPLQAMIRSNEVLGLKLTGRYQEAIAAGEKAKVVLAACHGVSSLITSGMALIQVECALHLRDFKIGKSYVERTRALVPKKTINGVKLSEFAVLLGLYTGEYKYAYEEIASLERSTLMQLLNPQTVEFWYILEAYVRFLIIAGKIEVSHDDQRLKNFRISKFMNDVPSYAANKDGMNIQILVLQAMFFIVRGELEKVVDRTDALDRYCNRYLKDNDNLRHSCFFRLLIEVVKGGFNLSERRKKIEAVYKRMTSKEALEISRKTNSEIVPYEVLWDIVQTTLRRRAGEQV